jgi:eukaryotic-like serine/threonine-protein kinase
VIGQRISHYRVISEIGSGGMGVVYLAEDTGLNRRVALKFLKADTVQNSDAEARLVREARAASALDHPNIATIYEIGEWNGHRFIAMAYYDGDTLAARLARGPIPAAQTVGILRQIAGALARAHQHGIVHRDLKPANIMIGSDGSPKILDFGLATAGFTEGATEERLTRSGTTMGTVAYMSPEQAIGARVDHRSDIWSLGVIAFQMLTGNLPFKGPHPAATLHSIMYDSAPDLTTAGTSIPGALRQVVRKALRKEPAARFQSADELAAALEAFATETATHAVRPPRRMLPFALVATAIFTALAGAAAVWAKQTADVRRARAMIPEIQRRIEDADWAKAYALASAARKVLRDDSTLESLWTATSGPLSVVTDPPGAQVYRKDYATPDAPWELLGATPLTEARIPPPFAFSRVMVVKPGYETIDDVTAPGEQHYRLDANGTMKQGMVRIAGGKLGVPLVGLDHLEPIAVSDYLIDRHETTNREFKRFVDAGGYQKREYWRVPFVMDDRTLSWEEAVASFKDRTGRTGPATWEVGDYPAGQDDYPVGGVSWYEAAAYAAFAGKELPTIYHWANAARVRFSSAVVPLSNLDGSAAGTAPVGTYQGLTALGTLDMAGNVREWCANETGSQRYLLGGAWDDAPYMFTGAYALAPFDRSPQNGFRLVAYVDEANLAATTRPIPQPYRDFRKIRPVPDEIFDVYRRMYAYDRTPLKPVIDERDDSPRDWVQQRVSFDAAYGHERVIAYVFLPKNAPPPYQTVVFFPGDGGLGVRSSRPLLGVPAFDFIVKSGRAFVYPIYKSTFERGDGLNSSYPTETNAYKEHVIQWAQDLMRSIDYVETRQDLDANKLAYYGISWGGRLGGIMLAIEPRIKAAVLNVAGLRFQKAFPEAEPINFLPRIKMPVLMLNGRYDYYFPVESSQNPMFEALGTPADQKRHIVADGSHFVPRPVLIKESLDWLDKYLGPVR